MVVSSLTTLTSRVIASLTDNIPAIEIPSQHFRPITHTAYIKKNPSAKTQVETNYFIVRLFQNRKN